MKNLIYDKNLGEDDDLPQVQSMRTSKKVLKYREREKRLNNKHKNNNEK